MQLEPQIGESVDLHPALASAASRGLHDTAQPLTVLQGLLELTLMQAQTVEDYRESVTTALAEMARVIACFENVRQLVRLQQPAPDVYSFSISEAVQAVVEELQTIGTKVAFSPAPAATEDLVHASRSRVRHALSLLISAVAVGSPGGVRILIDAPPLPLAVRLSANESSEALPAGMEMAHLVAASAGGKIQFSQTSYSVLLILPKAVVDQSTDMKGTSNHV
jgi:signal transduction histidine kinase